MESWRTSKKVMLFRKQGGINWRNVLSLFCWSSRSYDSSLNWSEIQRITLQFFLT